MSDAFDAPLKSTSPSQQGSKQTHKMIDPRMLQEVNGCVYKDTQGFYEREQTYSFAAERRATLPPTPGQWHISGSRAGERPLQSPVNIGRSCPAESSDLRGFAANQPQTCPSLCAAFQASNVKSGQSARGDHQ
jgi:hypothetical protein